MEAQDSLAVLAQGTAAPTDDARADLHPQVVGGLNDTVFGLSITLLATAIDLRAGDPPAHIARQLIGFAYAFFAVAIIWLRRYQLVRKMRAEPLGFIRLNFLLLFLVISYTWVLRLFTLSGGSADTAAVFLFALLTALVMGTLAVQHQYALRHNLMAPQQRAPVANARNLLLIGGLVFAVSTPLALIHLQLAFVCWLLTIPAGLVRRIVSARSRRSVAHSAAAAGH
jgi:uncharacterized membrane protein